MEHGHELAKNEDAMAAVEDFFEQLAKEIDFGGSGCGIDVVELKEAEIATDLAQAEQRIEDNHATAGEALRADRVSDFAAAGLEQVGVNRSLVGREFAVGNLLEFRGQIGGHFALEPAEHERAEPAGEPGLGGFVLFARDRNFVTLSGILGGTEVTRHQKVEDRLKIEDGILERRAGEIEAVM